MGKVLLLALLRLAGCGRVVARLGVREAAREGLKVLTPLALERGDVLLGGEGQCVAAGLLAMADVAGLVLAALDAALDVRLLLKGGGAAISDAHHVALRDHLQPLLLLQLVLAVVADGRADAGCSAATTARRRKGRGSDAQELLRLSEVKLARGGRDVHRHERQRGGHVEGRGATAATAAASRLLRGGRILFCSSSALGRGVGRGVPCHERQGGSHVERHGAGATAAAATASRLHGGVRGQGCSSSALGRGGGRGVSSHEQRCIKVADGRATTPHSCKGAGPRRLLLGRGRLRTARRSRRGLLRRHGHEQLRLGVAAGVGAEERLAVEQQAVTGLESERRLYVELRDFQAHDRALNQPAQVLGRHVRERRDQDLRGGGAHVVRRGAQLRHGLLELHSGVSHKGAVVVAHRVASCNKVTSCSKDTMKAIHLQYDLGAQVRSKVRHHLGELGLNAVRREELQRGDKLHVTRGKGRYGRLAFQVVEHTSDRRRQSLPLGLGEADRGRTADRGVRKNRRHVL